MKRLIIIDGKEITIKALGQPMDHAFDRLREAYAGNGTLRWDESRQPPTNSSIGTPPHSASTTGTSTASP